MFAEQIYKITGYLSSHKFDPTDNCVRPGLYCALSIINDVIGNLTIERGKQVNSVFCCDNIRFPLFPTQVLFLPN